MDNLIVISDGKSFDNLLNNPGKLIIIFYLDKTQGVCKQMHNTVQKASQMHRLTLFLVIDLTNFQGPVKFYNAEAPPFFVFHFNGNPQFTGTVSTEQQLNSLINDGQRMVMQAINQSQQNQRMNQQMNNNNNNNNNQMNRNQNNMYNNNNGYQQPMQQNNYQQQQQTAINQMLQQVNTAGLAVPSFAQMQQIFNIFIMLQKMGLMPIPTVVGSLNGNHEVVIDQSATSSETNKLPDGTPYIKLADGTYMIIQQNN